MKPLYILDTYDGSVRRERATPSEIRDAVTGRRKTRLASVDTVNGELLTYELTADDLKAIAGELEADVARRMHELLDAAAAIARQASALDGVSVGSFGVVTIWVESAYEGADRAALAWAEARGYEVHRGSPPADRKRWYPDATIIVEGRDICRVIWPEVEINTDAAVEKEIAAVATERETAARELASIGGDYF